MLKEIAYVVNMMTVNVSPLHYVRQMSEREKERERDETRDDK